MLKRLITSGYRIDGDVMFPSGEKYQMLAIQIKGRNTVANCFDGVGRGIPYCTPNVFKNDPGVLWKGTKVFINCCG